MKLNPDCIRDILLVIEGCNFNEEIRLNYLIQQLSAYTPDEIEYTCLKLYEGDFINALTVQLSGDVIPRIVSITDMTYSGHQLLENIRPDTVWEKTKTSATKIGSFSINVLNNIASNILLNLINTQI